MDLKDIIAVSGKPGLYKFIAPSVNGVIVESLEDGKRMNASGQSRVSSMTEIAIFTDGEDMPIEDVFRSIYKETEGKEAISAKSSPEELKAFFEMILPEYDRERVHVSDMKKVISWYNILHAKNMIDLEEQKEDNVEEEK